MECPKCGTGLIQFESSGLIPGWGDAFCTKCRKRYPTRETAKSSGRDEPTAQRLRDDGIERAGRAADPTWKRQFEGAVRELAAQRGHGGLFTADDVWDLLEERGVPEPREKRAVTHIYNRLVKGGLIRRTRIVSGHRKSHHAGHISEFEVL